MKENNDIIPTQTKEKLDILYNDTFSKLLSKENAYEYYMTLQLKLSTFVKMNENDYFYILFKAFEHLNKLDQIVSLKELLFKSLIIYKTHFIQTFPNKKITIDTMKQFHKLYLLVPEKIDKFSFKSNFLMIFKENNIDNKYLYELGIYKDFAKDSIINGSLIEGYNYSILSEDYDIICTEIKACFETNNVFNSSKEKSIFLIRTIFELLIKGYIINDNNITNKNINLCIKLLNHISITYTNYCKISLFNLCYLLLNLMQNTNDFNYDNMSKLVNCYDLDEYDPILKKYINSISNNQFKKDIFIMNNNTGMNIGGLFNVIRLFSNGLNNNTQ